MRKWQQFIGLVGLALVLFGLALALAGVPPVQASEADAPILQIDGGGHTAKIKDIAFTNDGRYLVSASNDKLVRVWDWATGKTVRTIRGQINKGREGKIFAMALSPDTGVSSLS